MFNIKNFNTPVILLSILMEKNLTIFKNTHLNKNMIVLSFLNHNYLPPIYMLTEFEKTSAIDVSTFQDTVSSNLYTNNVYFNYKWDIYLNQITSDTQIHSTTLYFPNRLWLEREIFEFFSIFYIGLLDTRPLLLNYGENIALLLKTKTVQPASELKTNWHKRNIKKILSSNIEL